MEMTVAERKEIQAAGQLSLSMMVWSRKRKHRAGEGQSWLVSHILCFLWDSATADRSRQEEDVTGLRRILSCCIFPPLQLSHSPWFQWRESTDSEYNKCT
jgi:hypothetical protein